jgi:hypothetical protein
MLSEFYEKVPSIVCMDNMDLKILTNLSPNNSWTVTYGATDVDGLYSVAKVESSQSVCSTCPFMLSEACDETCAHKSGLMITKVGNTGFPSIKVMPYIGYFDPTAIVVSNDVKVIGIPNMFPSSIHIPTVAYSSALRAEIAQSSKQLLLFNDFTNDIQIINKNDGTTCQHQLTYSCTSYLFPRGFNQT